MKKIDLDDMDKTVILRRYVKEVIDAERTSTCIWFFYYLLRILTSVGGVLMSSLLLLGKLSFIDETTSMILFWISWAISVIISISNECIYSFGIDKKFFINTMVLEKMKSEGWQYIELSGHYKKFSTHREAYKSFVSKIEKLKMEHVIQNLEANSEHQDHLVTIGSDKNIIRRNTDDAIDRKDTDLFRRNSPSETVINIPDLIAKSPSA